MKTDNMSGDGPDGHMLCQRHIRTARDTRRLRRHHSLGRALQCVCTCVYMCVCVFDSLFRAKDKSRREDEDTLFMHFSRGDNLKRGTWEISSRFEDRAARPDDTPYAARPDVHSFCEICPSLHPLDFQSLTSANKNHN